jgi:hypothetical protein
MPGLGWRKSDYGLGWPLGSCWAGGNAGSVSLSEGIMAADVERTDRPHGENKRKRKDNGVGLGKENRWAMREKLKRGEVRVGRLLGQFW